MHGTLDLTVRDTKCGRIWAEMQSDGHGRGSGLEIGADDPLA